MASSAAHGSSEASASRSAEDSSRWTERRGWPAWRGRARALARAKNPGARQKLVLASKAAGPSRGMAWMRATMTPDDIVAACDASLRRLQTDVIDLYQIHWPERHVPSFGTLYYDPAKERSQTPILAQLEALDGLVRAGKIRAIGLSNETPYGVHEFVRLAEQHGLARVATVQNTYCLINRAVDNGLDETMHRLGVSLLGYSPLGFGLLTVPGLQLLHCLQNETSGGFSTLVDSLAVAAQLVREDPHGFELLGEVPVRFEYRDADTQLVSVKPMIEVDAAGQMTGVHYSPRLDDIPLMSDTDTRRYHRARKRLGLLFEDPAFELRFKLEPGQLMIFDNNRVLHGRTSFDPSEGHRQLQGCYIDRDGPRSLYRVLRRRLASPPASVTTPTPELSHADS
jgi:hypothetical protein